MIPAIWLTKLLLSHLLTDFVLQPGKWIKNREEKHFRSPYLYLHGLITGISVLLFLGWQYWLYALIIMISHTLIDGWKSFQKTNLTYFFVDQLLHLLIILACWYHVFYNWQDIITQWKILLNNYNFWIISTAFVLISLPAGIVIGLLTKRWSDQLPNSQGLAKAGKWIGILERTLILIFILQDQFGAIGLLITAKGLLRFSEKDRQEEKTEYVLIGSLISVGISLITGLLVKHLIT